MAEFSEQRIGERVVARLNDRDVSNVEAAIRLRV